MGCATPVTQDLFDRRMTFIVDKDKTFFHEEICRLCGQREPSLWNLFEACDNNGNLNLPEKIFTCLNIMVEMGDGLPDQICGKCMTVIRCFFEFRQQCVSQDAMLRKSLMTINMLKMPNSINAVCESPCVGYQERNKSPLTSSQQHLLQCQTPEIVHRLEEEWAEDISVAAVQDLKKTAETPWRIDFESSTHGNEVGAEKTMPIETIDANGNVDTLRLINRLDSPPRCCNDHPNEYDELSFLSPDKITGDLILINKSDSESESIDIESIEDVEDRYKTDITKFKELCAGRISRNKDGVWKCNICSGEYISLLRLKKHIMRHYSGYPNQCVECEAFFETSDALDLHQIHHITSCLVLGHTCPHCYKSFRLKHLLKKHLAAEHVSSNDLKSESKKFRETCGKCARVFYSSFEMENHDESCEDLVFDSDDESSEESSTPTKKVDSGAKYLNLCHVCKLSFDNTLHLQLHLKMFHKTDDQLKCNEPECNKTFRTAKALHDHRRYHNPTLACNVCNKHFVSSDKLNDHLRIHSGEKPFKCSLCDKSFSCLKGLSHHKNNHFKMFECELCEQVFGSKSNLSRHKEEIHKRLKTKFMCETCGDFFNRKENLLMHNFYHHEQYNFCCIECKKVFQTKESYERHQLLHIKRSPISCKICCKEYSSKSTLKDHMKKYHLL